MSLFCRLGRHSAGPRKVWNNGYYFSRCSECGSDLISKSGRKWRAAPIGMKVVWKPRTPDDIVWSELVCMDRSWMLRNPLQESAPKKNVAPPTSVDRSETQHAGQEAALRRP